ncbi:MAG: hypothetical protein IGS03_00880 [Candidatus Sericytochromatia bacterium]|nr:hypothetical protein [Candidatus Sericytochromatia bacterium]
MSQAFPFNDLTALLQQAHRGLKRDVAPLVDALPEGGFFVSLARPLDVPDEMTIPPVEAAISSHMLQHPDGAVYVALFTHPDFVRKAQQEQNWQTEDGQQLLCPLPARNALYYALKLMANNEQVMGLFINAYQDQSLMLNALEVDSLFNGVAVPFEAYAQQVPFEEGDGVMVRPADVSSVEGFNEALEDFKSQDAQVKAYEVVALFDEQRNMQPFLAINFKTEGASPEQYGEIAQRFVALLQERVDFPERLEIMFDEEFPNLI